MTIADNNKLDTKTLNTYESIDELEVIKELIAHRGSGVIYDKTGFPMVRFKDLEDMALIIYQLKSNQTNKLNVRYRLLKYYNRNLLTVSSSGEMIRVPKAILSELAPEIKPNH